ncbi:unnamed protein product [Lactuca virosa]|uniref:Uncharacterized protein n=1 Tax=Lactuca virosa TaxID=75947 RepID=A0AAU9MPL8_9ASTR|nr:unnamed protein product [Lactuca virosa]
MKPICALACWMRNLSSNILVSTTAPLVVRVWATAKKLRIEYMISYMLRFMLLMQFYAGTLDIAGSVVLSAKPAGDNEGIIGHGPKHIHQHQRSKAEYDKRSCSGNSIQARGHHRILHQQPRPRHRAHARHVPSDAGEHECSNRHLQENHSRPPSPMTKHTTPTLL